MVCLTGPVHGPAARERRRKHCRLIEKHERTPDNPGTHMMTSWVDWLVAGLILVALEMAASGGFYIIFFGVAALAISLLHLFDLAGPVWFQLLLFSVFSILSLVLFRNPLMRALKLDRGAEN